MDASVDGSAFIRQIARMSLEKGFQLEIGDLEIRGVSSAGIGTCLYLPKWRLCFDVAQGLPFALSAKYYFITHGHSDHAGGIPYLISQKALGGQKPPIFYMPQVLKDPLEQIMKLWSGIEGYDYNFEFNSVGVETKIPLSGPYFVRPFQTVHRVPSFGYTIFQTHKKLKENLRGLQREELIEKRERGEELEETFDEPLVSFTGDTKIEFLQSCDWIKKSKTLILEVTYFDNKRSVEEARKWGHVHFDEVVARLHEIESENIVLMHFSARYSRHEIERIVRSRVSEKDFARIHLFCNEKTSRET